VDIKNLPLNGEKFSFYLVRWLFPRVIKWLAVCGEWEVWRVMNSLEERKGLGVYSTRFVWLEPTPIPTPWR